jgi:hypothetical protein
MRIFTIMCSALFAVSFAIAAPVHAKDSKSKSASSIQRLPAKSKSPPWRLGWFTSKPTAPKPPRCRG